MSDAPERAPEAAGADAASLERGDGTGGLAGPGVRVLLVGAGSYRAGSALPDIAVAGSSVTEIGQVLTERCGVQPAGLRTMIDPPDPLALGAALAEAAGQATDVLMFYYVGHGLVSAEGELHLGTAVTAAASQSLGYTALPFRAVRAVLDGCRARIVVIVLDCCFAARADGLPSGQVDDAFASAQVRGSYLLAAAARDEHALAPEGQRCTAFSGALVSLLRDGDPRGPRWLTLDHAYRFLAQALPAAGLPRPRRHVGGLADDLALAPNPAYRPPAPATPELPAAEAGSEFADGGAEPRSPYPGLAAFGPADARFFFGRARLTTELTARLADAVAAPGPVVVVGASGSGKSSLLRAGLVTAMQRGSGPLAIAGAWLPVVLTPGEEPLARLAGALAPARPGLLAEVSARLRADPASLPAVLGDVMAIQAGGGRAGSGPAVVLLVDQFEEVFTLCADEAERGAFIEALRAAAADRADGAAALVVLALRADCYSHCLAYPSLLAALRDRPVLVRPMTDSELAEAIEEPAYAAGYTIAPGLTELLLRDLRGGGPGPGGDGALPLLAYALLATWQRREGREMTMSGYHAAGGIWSAVAQAAERLLAQLPGTGQAAVRAILLAMIRVGEGTEDTRCTADLDELMNRRFAADAAAFTRARDELAAARLITLGQAGATITHEALLRAWPRLRDWISTDRAALLLRQRFTDAAATWQRVGRDPAALYRGTLLADATAWTAQHGDLSPLERDFLTASTSAEHAERRAQHRRARLRQVVTAAMAMLTAVSVTLTVVALRAYQNARASQLTAQSEAFASQALIQRYTNPQAAALLALAAWRSAPTVAARGSLLSVATSSYRGVLIGASRVASAAFSPDGRYLATTEGLLPGVNGGRPDNTVRLWDVRTRREVAVFPVNGPVASIAFSPDGRDLAAAVLTTRTVWLWHVTSRRPVATMAGSGATALAYGPDGRVLAIGSLGQVELIDRATMARIAVLPGGFSDVRSLAFSKNGRLLVAGGGSGSPSHPSPDGRGLTRVWYLPARTLLATLPNPGTVNSVALSPDGQLLASGGDNGTITFWSTTSHGLLAPLTSPGAVTAVAFSPDGLAIVAAYGQTLKDWLISSRGFIGEGTFFHGTIYTLGFSQVGQMLFVGGAGDAVLLRFQGSRLSTPAQVTSTAVSRDGRLIATAGPDGAIRLWNAADTWQARLIAAHRGGVQSVAFSPHGRLLASGGADGYVRLWDPATGRPVAAMRAVGPVVTKVTFSPDGSRLAAASFAASTRNAGQVRPPGAIQVWDTATRQLLATFRVPWGVVLAGPAFSPDGSLLAIAITSYRGEAVGLLRTRDLRGVGPGLRVAGEVHDVAFSPTGMLVAAGLDDGTVVLWDPRTSPEHARTITGVSGQARAVAFSPDGRTLAVGSSDGLVRIFDARTGALDEILTWHTASVNGLAFTPDGHTLISAGADDTAVLWALSTRSAVQNLCHALQGPGLARQWAALRTGVRPPC